MTSAFVKMTLQQFAHDNQMPNTRKEAVKYKREDGVFRINQTAVHLPWSVPFANVADQRYGTSLAERLHKRHMSGTAGCIDYDRPDVFRIECLKCRYRLCHSLDRVLKPLNGRKWLGIQRYVPNAFDFVLSAMAVIILGAKSALANYGHRETDVAANPC
jgi:hypothetical protein